MCAGHHNTIAYVAGADPGFFLGGGALVSCATSTPINHIVFHFLQNTSCIRKPQVISRGGGAHPLHPPPRSAPVWLFLVVIISGEWIKRIRRGKSNNIGLILPVLTTSTVPTRVPIGKKLMLSALHLRFNVNLSYI